MSYRDGELDDWRPVTEPGRYRSTATTRAATSTASDDRRMVHRLYLPVSVCAEIPALTDDPFRTPTEVYALLTAAGWDLRWVEHVRAAVPTPGDTTTLALPPATPVLITRRVTTDTQLSYPQIPTTG